MNDLAILEQTGELSVGKYADEKVFDTVAKQSAFLARVQLYGSNSNLVKRGKFPIGHYGLVRSKDNVVDLTNEFNCLVLAWRPKALKIDGDDTKAWYNPQSAAFKDVVEASKVNGNGNMYGPEFLIYLPGQREFVTFFFGNPTFRRSAPLLKGLMNKAATVGCELIEKKKFSWHGPTITQCTAPLALPTEDAEKAEFVTKLKDERDKFNNPPEEEVEVVATDDNQRAR